MKMLITGIAVGFLLPGALGQQTEIIDRAIKQAENRKVVNVERGALFFPTPDMAMRMINDLKKYKASSSTARFTSLVMAYKIADDNPNVNVKKAAVNLLTDALADEEQIVWRYAARRLQEFRSTEFSYEAKAKIANLIKDNNPKKEIILVVGTADIKNLTGNLRQIIQSNAANDSASNMGKWYGKVSWAAHLALARLGSKEDIQYCISRIESEKDDLTRVAFLLNDLAYIRQEETVNVLKKYLDTENELPPHEPGTRGTKYNDYAIRLLSQIIEGFPVAFRDVGYDKDETEKARAFMRSKVYKIKR